MTLAPPDLPLFFEDIAVRILKQLFPKDFPDLGSCIKESIKEDRSLFIEEYLFESFFSSRSKSGVSKILKLIQQLVNCFGFHFAFLM